MRFTDVLVYTFKDGLLSAVAHDLKLRVTSFEIKLETDVVHARFDPTSLRVVCARKDGRDAPELLPRPLFADVEKNIEKHVLDDDDILFTGAIAEPAFEGELTLNGRTQAVHVDVSREATRIVARARIDQRDFGIKPFAAMMGTLRIKPYVEIEVRAEEP